MTRRRLTMILHWTVFALLVLLLIGYRNALVSWAFVLAGAGMIAMALIKGLYSKPGPGLDGFLRVAHPVLHWAMYGFLAVVAVFTALAQFGAAPTEMSRLYFILLYASFGHGTLQVMRQMSPGDAPLRNMTPKSMHSLF
jgi:cytochrome b561